MIAGVKYLIRSIINKMRFRDASLSIFSSLDYSTKIGKNVCVERNVNIYKSTLGNHTAIYKEVDINQTQIEDFVKIHSNSTLINSYLGRYSYVSGGNFINAAKIGAFCSIGPNVKIGFGEHPVDFISTSPLFYSNGGQTGATLINESKFEEVAPVEIGNDVHIGANAYIKNGIRIGNGVIIGAGAVVVKDIEDFSIVGGVPAKLIRKRFSEDIISAVNDIEWWNYDISILKDKIEFFQKPISLEAIIELGKELRKSDKILSKS